MNNMTKQANRGLAAMFIGLCCTTSALALSQDDVLFYAPMDDSTDAVIAKGEKKPLVRGKADFDEGKYGKAYMTGRKGDELLYSTKDNIDVKAGTVAMWVKSLGWWRTDDFMRFWFRVGEAADAGGKGEGNFIWVYKYLNAVPLYYLVQQEYYQRGVYCIGTDDVYFENGKPAWTHIAVSWCGPVMRLYVNGKQISGVAKSLTPLLLKRFDAHFGVGGQSWAVGEKTVDKPDSLIDEVYIFKRPLTGDEIRTLIDKGKDILSTPKEYPCRMDIQTFYLPSQDKLTVDIMVNGRRQDESNDYSLVYTVENVDEALPTPIECKTYDFKTANDQVAIDVAGLKPGNYRVLAALREKGRLSSFVSSDFQKPQKPEWLGNTIGVPTNVPAPWSPIVKKENTLECWGRKVTYTDGVFPAQLTSQGTELLAHPVRLMIKVNGKEQEVRNCKITWKSVTPLKADYSVAGEVDGIKIKAECWMEFDGFVWTEVILPPASGKTLEGVRIEMPVKASIATIQQSQSIMRNGPRSGKPYAWKCAIQGYPFLWLGNEEVGVQWSTDNCYDWEHADAAKTLELQPGKDECLFIVRMVDKPIPLDHEMRFTVGLEATPVKPLSKDHHAYDMRMNSLGWRTACNQEKPAELGWNIWFQKWNAQWDVEKEGAKRGRWMPGYQVPGPMAKTYIQEAVAAYTRPFLYWDVNAVWRGAPDYKAFHKEWNYNSPPALPYETARADDFASPFRTVPSFRDWAIWRYHKSLKENPWLVDGMAGFYNDVVEAFWGAEPRVDRDGLVRTRYELLGVRELQKRLYVFARNEFPGKVILNHQSGNAHMCQLAFANIQVTGENYRMNDVLSKEKGYYNVLSLDACKAELLAGHWGISVMFLPENASSAIPIKEVYGPAGIPASEHLVGLLLIHDAIPWPSLIHVAPLMRLTALKEKFGWDEQTEYIGYWKTGSLVKLKADQDPVVVAVFKRPQKVMFAVMNNSDQPAQVTLTPDWKALGIPAPQELTDAYTDTPVPDEEIDVDYLNNVGKAKFKGDPKTWKKMAVVKVAVKDGGVSFTIPKRNFRVFVTP